jgi:hypothetical protein
MSMKWIAQYCKNARFILKIDDDIFVNTFLLIRHLDKMLKQNRIGVKSLLCFHYKKNAMRVNREGKWKIERSIFSAERFGAYCSGSAFLLTNDLPKLMYETSKYIKFFWIDDYYITGPLARAVNCTYIKLNTMYILNTKYVLKALSGYSKESIMFAHLPKNNIGQAHDSLLIWNSLLREQLFHFPSLESHANQTGAGQLRVKDDFQFIDDFVWLNKMWLEENEIKIN